MSVVHNTDVHVGTPPPDYHHWTRTTIHFHGFPMWDKEDMELKFPDYESSARFSCLGSEWELGVRFVRKRFEFTRTLTYRSSASCNVTYAITLHRNQPHSVTTDTFHCGSKVEKVTRQGCLMVMHEYYQKALVIEVFMIPASHTFHAYLPTNPSACKIVQDLFNDEKFADIVFEVGGGIKTSEDNESENMPSSIKYYAHRNIIEKAAPLLAEFCASDKFPSLVKLEDVSKASIALRLWYRLA